MSLEPTIIDVRTPGEYQDDHIGQSLNIPLDEIQARIHEFREMKTPIILYCRAGNRSGVAVTILKQHGITGVINGGGINDMRGDSI